MATYSGDWSSSIICSYHQRERQCNCVVSWRKNFRLCRAVHSDTRGLAPGMSSVVVSDYGLLLGLPYTRANMPSLSASGRRTVGKAALTSAWLLPETGRPACRGSMHRRLYAPRRALTPVSAQPRISPTHHLGPATPTSLQLPRVCLS